MTRQSRSVHRVRICDHETDGNAKFRPNGMTSDSRIDDANGVRVYP